MPPLKPNTCGYCSAKPFKKPQGLSNHCNKCEAYQEAQARLALKPRAYATPNSGPSPPVASTSNDLPINDPIPQQTIRLLQSPQPEPTPPPENPVSVGPSPPPTVPLSRRPRRRGVVPSYFEDELPPEPPSLDHDTSPSPSPDNTFTTSKNSYGVYRVYSRGRPTLTPDDFYSISRSTNTLNLLQPDDIVPTQSWWSSESQAQNTPLPEPPLPSHPKSAAPTTPPSLDFTPFDNPSVWRVINWAQSRSTVKSNAEVDRLVHSVIRAPDFNPDDLKGFQMQKELDRLDTHLQSQRMPSAAPIDSTTNTDTFFSTNDGWITATLTIPVSCEKVNQGSEWSAKSITIPGIRYRKLMPVIKTALQEPMFELAHLIPFREYWDRGDGSPPERLYGELYTGDYINNEYDNITASRPAGSSEVALLSLMFASDSTLLTTFGGISLWPIYLAFGNQSKYDRAHPSSFAMHHIAYVPKIDSGVFEQYMTLFGCAPSKEVLTQIWREIIHGIWGLLLDDEFVEAYVRGFPWECWDEVIRHFFVRVGSYASDYPERVLLALIQYFGKQMCTLCLAEKQDIELLGTTKDLHSRLDSIQLDTPLLHSRIKRARTAIFKGKGYNSKKVEDYLGDGCYLPMQSAFSKRLQAHGFNTYEVLGPDVMHECELGVWKAVFTHLVRILSAKGGNTIQILNSRYRSISLFGNGTIRKFPANVSAMKRLAARDFEDMLQCAIPCFDGLLEDPEQDRIISALLFELATWHGLAKLRLESETNICELQASGVRLGRLLRRFKNDVCSKWETKELAAEEGARGRKEAADSVKGKRKRQSGERRGPKKKEFNLRTFKLHNIGHYPLSLRRFGSSENTSLQPGELEHKHAKRFVPTVQKGGDYAKSIGVRVDRERFMAMSAQKEELQLPSPPKPRKRPRIPSRPGDRYNLAENVKERMNIFKWVGQHEDDPSRYDFIRRLKDHILCRLQGAAFDGDDQTFTSHERNTIKIIGSHIYTHKTLLVNYTTYDGRREQDTISPTSRRDIMLLAPEEYDNPDFFPYWYARVLGIHHVLVRIAGESQNRTFPFVYVRWFGYNPSLPGGWKNKRLHRIGFVDGIDPFDNNCLENAFGFLDPALIIRGVHIIPAFAYGKTEDLLGPSIARLASDEQDGVGDYQFYYVSMFADRDLLMRHRGGGVGHHATRRATGWFEADRDPLDVEYKERRDRGEDPITEIPDDDEETDDVELGPPSDRPVGSEDSEEDDEESNGSEDESDDSGAGSNAKRRRTETGWVEAVGSDGGGDNCDDSGVEYDSEESEGWGMSWRNKGLGSCSESEGDSDDEGDDGYGFGDF